MNPETPSAVDMYMSTPEEERRASAIVSTLEGLWDGLRRWLPDLPDAVIIIGQGRRRGSMTLGHWCPGSWQLRQEHDHLGRPVQVGEVFVAGEQFNDPEEVLDTLLHEAAHAVATARRVKDTSRQGRYHNRRYKVIAESLGLIVTQSKSHGWNTTALGPLAQERHHADLKHLASVLGGQRQTFRPWPYAGASTGAQHHPPMSPASGRLLLACACRPTRRIRVSASVAARGPIVCGVCIKLFHPTGSSVSGR